MEQESPDWVRTPTPATHYLLFPGLIAALTIVMPDWHFSNPLDIDQWVYYGFFRHLTLFRADLFNGTYYASRLGWIFPGHVVYSLFREETASFVLHAVYYAAAVYSLYTLVKETAGARIAFAAAVLVGLYLPFIRALGSDYVECGVITYALIGAMLMQRSGHSGPKWASFASGFAAGTMFHSNIGAAFLMPSILVWAVPASARRSEWFGFTRRVLVWMLGIVASTAVFALISVRYGDRLDFFIPSVRWVVGMGARNPWDRTGVAWVLDAPWIFLPLATLIIVASVLASAGRRRRLDERRLRALASFAVTVAIYVTWDFAWSGAILYWPFYASWLIPFSLLALASVVLGTLETDRRLWLTSLIVAAPLLWSAAHPWSAYVPMPMLAALGVSIALAAVAAVLRSPSAVVMTLAVLLVQLNGLVARPEFRFYIPFDNRVDTFRIVNQSMRIADPYIAAKQPELLIEENSGMATYFNAFASAYLWGYVMVTDHYPSLEAKPNQKIRNNALVIIVSTHSDERPRFEPFFTRDGMSGTVLGHHRLQTKYGPMDLTFVRAKELPDAAAQGSVR